MFSRLASRTRLAAVAAAVALFASAGSAQADTINFTGSTLNTAPANDGVSFSGTMTLSTPTTVGGTTSATLTISITNTTSTTYPGSDAVKYGYITGFGFNVPNNVTATASKTGNFNFLSAAANTTSLQGGEFDYAFSTSASELHTVATNEISKGLAAGQSATFAVKLTGSGLLGLTAEKLIQELSASPGYKLSVRFRSTDTSIYKGNQYPDGDKVEFTSYSVVTPPPPSAVPAPPGLVLASIGFGSLFFGRLRFRRAK
ncbi:hypothetical protein R5W23_002136 [Gemmata sp. JC673]|uniref:PEP-CTERM sorting domain-containing protein n=1 Tax=Gemmata algarum TaxID=2975278 RepID=A0ABU5F011_9BACT|nr:hypothetical protein [Gemmata algarum]MDY3560887.1 hypothetical protein [Gemmata algarum]